MSKTIYIKCVEPCLIEYQNKQEIIENTYSFVKIDCDKVMYLKYFPLSQKASLPKILKLDPNNINVKHFDCVKYDNAYELTIKPTNIQNIKLTKTVKSTFNLNPITVFLSAGDKSLLTISQDTDVTIEINGFLNSLQTKQMGNFFVIYCELFDATQVVILNSSLSQEFNSCLKDFEITNTHIKGYYECNDIAKHGIVYEIEVGDKVYAKTNTVYLEDRPQLTKLNEITPFAFLESIKVKNYKLARNYLSTTLSNRLDDLHLGEFFGDFCQIRQNVYKKLDYQIALIYDDKKQKFARLFQFEIKNNKIINILTT